MLSAFLSSLAYAELGMNDISVLIPLPKNELEMKSLLSAQNKISDHSTIELMPENVFKFLPVLIPTINQLQLYNNNLKVIALRFDPCFTEGFSPTACQSQIRLVWQPVIFKSDHNGNLKPSTIDAAIHSFYNLDAIKWKALMSEINLISVTDIKLPLQIHPTILSQGLDGIYWNQLKKIILKYANKDNLIRATAMTVRMDRVWGFQGVDLKDNQWTAIEIPTLKILNRPEAKVTSQAFFLEPESLLDLTEFKGGASLLEINNQSWFRLLSDSKKYGETQTENEIKVALGLAYNLENPKKHNPGTIDCVSCHLAQTIRLWGSEKFKTWDFNQLFKSEIYQNKNIDLKNTSVNPANTNRARAFGYFDDEPIISQRIINETAQILYPQ